MITLNRLGHSDEPFQLNPDMIVTVESTPDTVIALATGAKVVVAESPRMWRLPCTPTARTCSATRSAGAETSAASGGPGRPRRDGPRLSAVERQPT